MRHGQWEDGIVMFRLPAVPVKNRYQTVSWKSQLVKQAGCSRDLDSENGGKERLIFGKMTGEQ
jgi:hypothetical protein